MRLSPAHTTAHAVRCTTKIATVLPLTMGSCSRIDAWCNRVVDLGHALANRVDGRLRERRCCPGSAVLRTPCGWRRHRRDSRPCRRRRPRRRARRAARMRPGWRCARDRCRSRLRKRRPGECLPRPACLRARSPPGAARYFSRPRANPCSRSNCSSYALANASPNRLRNARCASFARSEYLSRYRSQ